MCRVHCALCTRPYPGFVCRQNSKTYSNHESYPLVFFLSGAPICTLQCRIFCKYMQDIAQCPLFRAARARSTRTDTPRTTCVTSQHVHLQSCIFCWAALWIYISLVQNFPNITILIQQFERLPILRSLIEPIYHIWEVLRLSVFPANPYFVFQSEKHDPDDITLITCRSTYLSWSQYFPSVNLWKLDVWEGVEILITLLHF